MTDEERWKARQVRLLATARAWRAWKIERGQQWSGTEGELARAIDEFDED
jgi:hypothetical protein